MTDPNIAFQSTNQEFLYQSSFFCLTDDFPMTHTLIAITQYAGIVLGNVYFSRPTYNLIFVICFIVLITNISHAHHSFIIAESFPVTVTNHTSRSVVVYNMCS